jgi:hypothetical protein
VRLNEGGQPIHRVAVGRVANRCVCRPLEGGCGSIDDRPQDVFLRGDVGVETGTLDVECFRDVADGRRRVAVGVEQLARHFIDLATPAAGLDHAHLLPNGR